jgi:GNAT superfamily N-acetyltransferase
MPPVNVRHAVKEDCPHMLELVQELATYERAPEEVTVTLEHFMQSGFGAQPVWWAFVAESEGTIVGFALYYVRYSTWKGQKMYLEDIIVTEDMRGKGIGALLMNALIKEGQDKGFQGMTWQVLDWNEPAINFYKKYESRFDNGWVNAMLDF